jgi:HD superfamily phosphohydrolase
MGILHKGRKIKLDGKEFLVVEYLSEGGSGEVYRVVSGGQTYALKLFFPFYQLKLFGSKALPGKIEEALQFQKKEYDFLSTLSHPNILKVFNYGEIPLQRREQNQVHVKGIIALPALLVEFVEGLRIDRAIKEMKLDAARITHALDRVALALEYLHADRKYMHMDVKAANVLLRKVDGEPVLIDFALCKNLNFSEVGEYDQTQLLGDWDLFPKQLPTEHRLRMIKASSGSRKEILSLAFPALDLFQFGKLLNSLLPQLREVFQERELQYITTLAEQLTDWDVVTRWGPRDLRPRVGRLAPEHFMVFGVPELTEPASTERTIAVPPGIGIPISKTAERLIETRSWRRLTLINQLCLLSVVYPGADYKRAVHVLFSYDLARQLVTHLYSAPLFRLLFDRRSATQLLAVVLLHDINHFPFLHVFQESEIPGLDKLEVLNLFCDGQATGEKAAGKPSIYDLLNDLGLTPERFKRLLFQNHHEQASDVDCVISSVLNSGVDVDKLSYLFLDGYFTGVRYGAGIDYPCLLKAATIGRVERARGPHLGFTDRAFQAAENVIMTRYWNFRSLYWHHTNRAIMAMLLHVARSIYITKQRDVKEYLLDTRWCTDVEALRYLDAKFKSQIDCPSILDGVLEDRSRVYRRLYTVRAGLKDEADDALFKACRSLRFEEERKLCAEIAKNLGDLLSKGLNKVMVDENEVLMDIPRREMDSGGPVYFDLGKPELVTLATISEPIRSLNVNYEQLTKRVRFFISPRVAGSLGRERLTTRRGEFQHIISESLKAVTGAKQVR